jgi:hypothetical protein
MHLAADHVRPTSRGGCRARIFLSGDERDAREPVEEPRDRLRSPEEAKRENRRIIAGLVQRVPELKSP